MNRLCNLHPTFAQFSLARGRTFRQNPPAFTDHGLAPPSKSFDHKEKVEVPPGENARTNRPVKEGRVFHNISTGVEMREGPSLHESVGPNPAADGTQGKSA